MSKSKKKLLVVVLGMHRSGTSAITRGLQVLGIDLGDELMPPAPDNETGFFEDREINALNVELLRSLGHDWHSLGPIKTQDLTATSLEPLRQRAMEVLRVKMRSRDSFGLKDPRLSRLLPFWKRVFQKVNVEARYVIAVRNPVSVARSLEARNQFAPARSYYLWLEHLVSSILETRGSKRVVVDYDRLIEKPKIELERIARALRIHGAKNDESVREYREQYLSEQLRHTQFGLKDIEAEIDASTEVTEAFRLLSAMASDRLSPDAPTVHKAFKHFEAFLLSAAHAFRCLNKQDQDLAYLRDAVVQRDAHIAFIEGVLVQRNNDLEAARNAVAAYAQDLTTQQAKLEAVHAAGTDMELELDTKRLQLDERTEELVQLKIKLDAAAVAIEEREREIDSSRGTIEELRRDLEVKSRHLETLTSENRDLQGELERRQGELARRESDLELAHLNQKKLEAVLQERSQEVDQLNGNIARLANGLDEAVAAVGERDQEILALREKIELLTGELEGKSGQLETHRRENDSLLLELQQVRSENSQSESALKTRSRQIDRLSADIAELTNSLATTAAKLKAREQETTASYEALEHLRGQMKAASDQLEVLAEEKHGLHAQLQTALVKAASAESEMQQSRQAIGQLREEAATLRRAIDNTTQGMLGVASSLESAVERRILRGGQ